MQAARVGVATRSGRILLVSIPSPLARLTRISAIVIAAATWLAPTGPRADTISGALRQAYANNPAIGAQRAATRAADETLAQAKAGFRPQLRADGFLGPGYAQGFDVGGINDSFGRPLTGSLTATQNLYNGGRTIISVRRAETTILSSRERLRQIEQDVLLDAAFAYMDVLRDTAILDLDGNNIAVLREQLRHTRDQYTSGYVSATDLAQALASLEQARADYAAARAALQASLASLRRVIGMQPRRLEAARPIDALLPRSLDQAILAALREHPSVADALHRVDAAALQVKLEEGRLHPSVDISANVQGANDSQGFIGDDQVSPGDRLFAAGGALHATVPIYAGGEVDAAVRRSKELLGQARLQAEGRKREVRARLETAWARLSAAREAISSSLASIKAAEAALYGVREEADAGRRTTLDVLRALQALLRARVDLVQTQHDRVVLGYEAMAAIGRLSVINLGLIREPYDPTVHFDSVKDRWFGLRTPDGQ